MVLSTSKPVSRTIPKYQAVGSRPLFARKSPGAVTSSYELTEVASLICSCKIDSPLKLVSSHLL
eukprot:5698349-Prymnesium_polylepis.1